MNVSPITTVLLFAALGAAVLGWGIPAAVGFGLAFVWEVVLGGLLPAADGVAGRGSGTDLG